MAKKRDGKQLASSASAIVGLDCAKGKPFSEYPSGKLAGFGVRVMASGKKVYFVKCRVKGQTTAAGTPLQVKITLGTFTMQHDEDGRLRPDTEQYAQMYEKADRIIKDAEAGIAPEDREREAQEATKERERQRKVEEEKDVTLRDYLNRYLEAKQGKGKLKASTADQYRQTLETHCADWLDMPARDITKAMIEERHLAISERRTVTVKPGEKIRGGNTRTRGGKGTADATMRVLRAVLNRGVKKDEIGALLSNPVDALAGEWFNLGRRTSSVTTDQLKAWFAGLEAIDNPAIKLMVQISIFTGARKNEVASLKWSDVNLDGEPPTAIFRETKNGTELLIPLAAYVVKLIQDYKAAAFTGPDGFLFPSFGKTGHIRDPRKQIKKAVDAGGVQFMPHDSRRTFLSFCNHEELSIPKWTQKRLCNHALPQDVTEGYVQHELKSLQATVERIAAFIRKHAGIVDTPPETTAEAGTAAPEKVVSLDQSRRKRRAA